MFAYSDNCQEKIGMDFEGRRVISTKKLVENHSDAYIIIVAEHYGQEIANQLIRKGFSAKHIIQLGTMNQKIYFNVDFVKPSSQEIFVDGGCYDGYSSEAFLQWAGNSAKKIYGFEPDAENYVRCKKYFQNNVKIPYELNITVVGSIAICSSEPL